MTKGLKLFIWVGIFYFISPSADIYSQSQASIYKGIILRGKASWYSENDSGVLKTTANMEYFNDTKLACAIWNVPFGRLLRVTNISNGKSVVVRVNDRGPARRLVVKGRIVDLTKTAFSQIASLDEGLIPVKISLVGQY